MIALSSLAALIATLAQVLCAMPGAGGSLAKLCLVSSLRSEGEHPEATCSVFILF